MKRYIFIFLWAATYACNNAGKAKEEPVAVSAGGESLFKNNCYQCHRVDAQGLGPNLAGVTARWSNETLLYQFIRNPQEVINTNGYARDLQKKYSGQMMLPFPQLSDAEINAVLQYCDEPK